MWGGKGRVRENVSLRGLNSMTPLFFRRLALSHVTSLSCLSPARQVHSVQVLQCPFLPLYYPEEHSPGDKAQVRGGHQRHLPHQPRDLPHVSQGASLGRVVRVGQWPSGASAVSGGRELTVLALCGHACVVGTALLCPLH